MFLPTDSVEDPNK